MMAEIPAPAAAAPVSVELPSPVVVEVTVAVDSAEPEPEAWVALAPPSAEERTERALAPVVASPEEADCRASGGRCQSMDRWRYTWIVLTRAVLGTESDHGGGLARTASLVGTVTDTVAEVGLPAVAEDIVLAAAELGSRNAEHVVDAGALRGMLAEFRSR